MYHARLSHIDPITQTNPHRGTRKSPHHQERRHTGKYTPSGTQAHGKVHTTKNAGTRESPHHQERRHTRKSTPHGTQAHGKVHTTRNAGTRESPHHQERRHTEKSTPPRTKAYAWALVLPLFCRGFPESKTLHTCAQKTRSPLQQSPPTIQRPGSKALPATSGTLEKSHNTDRRSFNTERFPSPLNVHANEQAETCHGKRPVPICKACPIH
eukprot:201449-Chlamydomonas_euryale.AAC.6